HFCVGHLFSKQSRCSINAVPCKRHAIRATIVLMLAAELNTRVRPFNPESRGSDWDGTLGQSPQLDGEWTDANLRCQPIASTALLGEIDRMNRAGDPCIYVVDDERALADMSGQ